MPSPPPESGPEKPGICRPFMFNGAGNSDTNISSFVFFLKTSSGLFFVTLNCQITLPSFEWPNVTNKVNKIIEL